MSVCLGVVEQPARWMVSLLGLSDAGCPQPSVTCPSVCFMLTSASSRSSCDFADSGLLEQLVDVEDWL